MTGALFIFIFEEKLSFASYNIEAANPHAPPQEFEIPLKKSWNPT